MTDTTQLTIWPPQNPRDMSAFYGNPDPTGAGVPDRNWEDKNLINITPPYKMFLAWAPTQQVNTIKVNKACADALLRILTNIDQHYGSPEAIQKARMHLFGGCYNFRLMRGAAAMSIHSWGAAIDIDPVTNYFGRAYNASQGMMPLEVIKMFQAEGWVWGGMWSKPDPMHFQAARV